MDLPSGVVATSAPERLISSGGSDTANSGLRSWSKWRPVLVATALLMLLGGCDIELLVTIDVEEDGSGTVSVGVGLDLAAQSLPAFSDVDSLLVVEDLVAAGWTVGGLEQRADGRDWFELSKPFNGADDLQSVLDELTGPEGAFRNWSIDRTSTSVRTAYEVSGTVDLSDGFDLFSDAELAALLEEPPLGISREALEAQLGRTLEESVTLRVDVKLPDSDVISTEVALGSSERVEASTVNENRTAQILIWVRWALIALLGLSIVLAVVNFLLDRRYERARPPRRPTRIAERVTGPGTGPTPARPAADVQRARPLQLLILDLHRVLFRSSGEPEDLLIPFVREKGGTASDAEIVEAHRLGTLGRISSAQFWERVGVDAGAAELDSEYVARFRLQSGAKEFLREMHRRGMPVAVITNDLSEWSHGLRELHGMQGMMPWIVSAEIGVRKPDPAVYEAVRRLTGLPYESCLIVDGSLESLDAAKSLGMLTAWFTRTAEGETSGGHPVVARFGDFFRRRRPAPVS